MTQPPRVGIMGLGQRGLQHLRSLLALQGEGAARVVALADAFEANLDAGKLRSHAPAFNEDGILRTTSFEDLLTAGLDALYVCIPPNAHRQEVIRAADAGLHLFVEKPMSLYLEEAQRMDEAIKRAGVLSTAGFQQRFDRRHEAVHNLLQAGRRPLMACYTFHGPLEGHNVKHHQTERDGGPSNRVWTANRAWSGMTVVEGGIHLLDLWRYWMGDVVWVQAEYQHRPPDEVFDGADNPYTYTAQFGFRGGAVGAMTLSRLRKVYASYGDHQLLWTEGRVAIAEDGVTAFHYDGPYPPSQPPADSSVAHLLAERGADDGTRAISRTFLRAVAEGNRALIRSPFDDAMNSLAAVLGANVSDRLGGARVALDQLLQDDRFAEFRRKPQ